MNHIDVYIKKIQENIEILQKKHREFFDSELLIAYRGEPRDYGKTKLMPSLFRDETYVLKEPHLFELFCDYNMVTNSASNIEKAIEAQHYAEISRMLDISFNVLVALYFACAHHDDNDGYVFAFAFPDHYSPHSKYIEDFYTDILAGKHIAYSRNFKVFSHSYSNDRIKAQKGGFIFFPGADFLPIDSCYYELTKIEKEDKKQILLDLDTLFQINEATIFPEKTNVAKVVKEKFKHSGYPSRTVSLQDEVDTYFNRVNYELRLRGAHVEPEQKKEFLRLLRKEQLDIVSYINKNFENSVDSDETKEELLNAVNNKFRVLAVRFTEAHNGH